MGQLVYIFMGAELHLGIIWIYLLTAKKCQKLSKTAVSNVHKCGALSREIKTHSLLLIQPEFF